jgi:hypothetical protein
MRSGETTSVRAGTRLVLYTDEHVAVLRALKDTTLTEGWCIPVLTEVATLDPGSGIVEVPTIGGVLRLQAHLEFMDGALGLREGEGHGAILLQRRADVRGPVSLRLRGAALDAAGADSLTESELEGATLTVSAGGLSADLGGDRAAPAGSRLYLELELPGSVLVPAVVAVIELSSGRLRARFEDIAPVDRERLVRLVFAEHRRQLAERRALEGRLPGLP